MQTIMVIGHNTFREAIRDKILYNLVFFSIMIIVFSYFLGELTMGENVKIMMDFGLTSITIFGVLIAIFVGIGLVYKELDKRTIYNILSKPIKRYQFLLGKFCGLALTLLVQLVVMTAILFLMVALQTKGGLAWPLLKAIYFIYLELLVLTAVALLFSSYSSPFLSAMFSLGFFLVGHSTEELFAAVKKMDFSLGMFDITPVVQWFVGLVRYINLDLLNIKAEVVHGVPLDVGWFLNGTRYALSIVVLTLLVSTFVLNRRDFK